MKALLAAGAVMLVVAGSASASTVMRVGNQGTTYASVDRSKAIGKKQMQNVRAFRFELFASAEVKDYDYDVDFNKVLLGTMVTSPTITGSYIIQCNRRSPWGYETSSGTLRSGSAVVRRVPMSRPDQCKVSVSVFAQPDATFPDEVASTVVRATVSTVKAARGRR